MITTLEGANIPVKVGIAWMVKHFHHNKAPSLNDAVGMFLESKVIKRVSVGQMPQSSSGRLLVMIVGFEPQVEDPHQARFGAHAHYPRSPTSA